MGLLDIFPKFLNRGSSLENNYLSLVLTPKHVLAAIWVLDDGHVHLIGTGEKPYKSAENLVHETAIAIDKAGEKAQGEVSKVVFGIAENWLRDKELPEESSRLFKKMSKELEIEPQAFIPLSAAINHFLKIKEGKPPNCILLGAYDDFSEVHLLSENKVTATRNHQTRLTESGLAELIKSLKGDTHLPSEIYIYGDNPKDTAEKLESSKLKESFDTPLTIEILDNKDLLTGVAFAQAADILGHEPQIGSATVQKDREEPAEEKEVNENELGFIEGEDVMAVSGTDIPEETKEEEVKEESEPEEPEKQEELAVFPSKAENYAVEAEEPHIPAQKEKRKRGFSLPGLPALPFNFSDLLGKKVALLIAGAVVVLLVGSFLLGQFLVSAKVLIKVNPKVQEGSFSAAVSTSPDEDEILGQEVSAKVEGSQKAVATGTKKTGESAKGDVTVFNWTTSPTTLKKDTVIISKDGIKFKLDSDIEVASRSASNPGQGSVPVVASDFGPSGNISGGQDFTFQQYDELLYSGRNDNAFSGGSEKQMTVVSADDLSKLEKSLTSALEQKVKDELKNSNIGKTIPDEAIKTKVLKKTFDKKADEEASLVNLNMEIEASAMTFSEDDLKNFLLKDFIKPEEGNQIRPQDIEIVDLSTKITKTGMNLSGKFKAKEIPKLDQGQLAEKIAGKSVKDARALIKETPQIADVEVKFSPSLFFANTVPRNKEKIQFEVKAD